MGTKGAWTDERRRKQAETIRLTRPWEKSTGPQTEEGKARSSRNACITGFTREARDKLNAATLSWKVVFGRSPRR